MVKQSFESLGRIPRAKRNEDSSSRDELYDAEGASPYSTSCLQAQNHQKEQAYQQEQNNKKPVNLLAKAVALLSRREYSEQELRRKLSRYTEDIVQIDAVIARLQKENWQSDQRFAENFVLFRQERWGNQKLLQALRQHDLPVETVEMLKEDLRETEFDRAKEVWERKFHGHYPTTPQEKAKQMRFLASRGFSADVVYKIASGKNED